MPFKVKPDGPNELWDHAEAALTGGKFPVTGNSQKESAMGETGEEMCALGDRLERCHLISVP